jgi:hypothetical protein
MGERVSSCVAIETTSASDMTEADLHPCPFCGSSNIQSDCYSAAFGIPAHSEDCFDYCKDCDAQGPAATDIAGAHERWNARGTGANNVPRKSLD